jgi:hypothetical protein
MQREDAVDPFESPYLNPVQLVAWVMTRNRELVAMAVADRARWDRKTARVAEVTTEGATVISTVEFEKPVGPISLRWLDVWLALHPRASKIPRRVTQKIIEHLLAQAQLHATGRRCGRGDRQAIDPPAWVDLELAEGFQAQSKLAEDVFWTDCLFLWDEVLVLWPPITKLVLASERGESSTPQPAAASPAVPPLAATKEEAHASEVVGPAPALQASEGEGTRARDQRLWDRRKELREKEPAITDSEIARRICKEEAAKVKAAKGKEIAGEEPKKRKPLTESTVRRILARMKKRQKSQAPSKG